MTDVPDNTDNTTPDPQPNEAPSPSAGTQNTENRVPQSRFNEVIQERNQLQERLSKLEADLKQQREQELAEQERYRELYEQTKQDLEAAKQATEAAQRYQQALQATNEARIQQIPEGKRHLVPEFDDPVKLGAWLDKAWAELVKTGKPTPPNLDGGSGSGGGSESRRTALSAEQQRLVDMARNAGYEIDPSRVSDYARRSRQVTDLTDETEDES